MASGSHHLPEKDTSSTFFLNIAILNAGEAVGGMVGQMVKEEVSKPESGLHIRENCHVAGKTALTAGKAVSRIAGFAAKHVAKHQKGMVADQVAQQMCTELPAALKQEVGLSLECQPVYLSGPVVVMEVTVTSLDMAKLAEQAGKMTAKPVAIGLGCFVGLAKCLGLGELLEKKSREAILKPVLDQLDVELPKQLKEFGGFDVVLEAVLPSQEPFVLLDLMREFQRPGHVPHK